MTTIFLSHSSNDKEFVRRLARDIERLGGTAWVDEAEMLIGDSLIQKIGDGIESMEFLGVVLSPVSVKSEWVKRELEIALNQEISGKKVKVLPLLKRKCDIPPFLQGKVYADFSRASHYHHSLNRVATAMGLDPDNSERVPGERMIRVRDLRKKLDDHFSPRKVDVEFFDDGSGLLQIVVWNADETFQLFSWETTPTDMELLSAIFDPEGLSPIREVRIIDSGPFPDAEREEIVAKLRNKYSLPADLPLFNWRQGNGDAQAAWREYEGWLFEISSACLSGRSL